MDTHLSIGATAVLLGVSVSTLRRWEETKRFFPDYRTIGGHRRYRLERLQKEFFQTNRPVKELKTIIYARVSSYDQKDDLKRQEARLIRHCVAAHLDFELISDLGSGLSYKKKGLKKLIRLICSRQICRIVLTHKDRLLRFGCQLLFKLCSHFNVEVVILEQEADLSFEQALTADVLEIMTVFSAKVHGKRSHKNRKIERLAA